MLAAVSFVAGLVVGARSDSGPLRVGREFASAWEHGDRSSMYALLSDQARARTNGSAFATAYRQTATTTTLEAVRVLGVHAHNGDAVLDVVAATKAFGRIRDQVILPIKSGKVDWRPNMTFPGVPVGAVLARRTRAPRRASILARDGRVIATGPADARSRPLGAVAESVAGDLGPPATQAERDYLDRRGFPLDTPIGTSGLERLVDDRLAGTPGGLLFAGGRVLASTRPHAAHAVRTTIDLNIQQAALTALAGRYGGIAVLDPRNAEIRALAGIAFSGPQPPGSTFKIVTATAALEAHLVNLSTPFPIETKAVIDGVDLQNANGESCGGSFAASFARSCNSVFAPLGVRIGAKRLVATAERFGWNELPAGLPGALPSTIPPASQITSPLAVGSTAIGQGKVLATPLELASVAQTVAAGGVRTTPTIFPGATRKRVRVMSRRIANKIEQLMIGVVAYGTGTAANLSPTKVAGKTGTAELTTTVKKDQTGQTTQPTATPTEQGVQAKPPGFDTDAWFTAYAPVRRPRVVVCVLIVHGGAGGATAAPAARGVLQVGLAAGR